MPVMRIFPFRDELEDGLVVVLVAAGIFSSQSSSKASRMRISSAGSARDVSINLTPIAVLQDRERFKQHGALHQQVFTRSSPHKAHGNT